MTSRSLDETHQALDEVKLGGGGALDNSERSPQLSLEGLFHDLEDLLLDTWFFGESDMLMLRPPDDGVFDYYIALQNGLERGLGFGLED